MWNLKETNKQKDQTHKKEIRLVVTRGRGWGEGKLEEGGQTVQTSIYKILRTRDNVQHNYSQHYCMIYRKGVDRVKPMNYHKEKIFFLLFYLYKKKDVR